MPRLTDADARRLAGALGQREPVSGDSRVAPASSAEEDAQRVLALFADAAPSDELGRAITLDLASYLNRPVRCSVTVSTAPMADAWRFETAGRGFALWIDFEVSLAAAFADAMIGGNGAGNVGRGRRVRALAEKIAHRIFGAIASAAGIEAPYEPVAAAARFEADCVLGGGLCALATDQFAWQTGLRVAAPAGAVAVREDTAPEPIRLLDPSCATGPSEPPGPVTAYAPSHERDPEAVLRAAVDAIPTHLQETLRCQIGATDSLISRKARADLAALPSAALSLALTAGGNGAVVAFLNAEGVSGLAGGAVGASLPWDGAPGGLALAAAEAIVREALCDVARRLPAIAADVYHIVRLSEDALPARTEHHVADVRFTIGERTGTLRLLVPSWMLADAAAK